MSKMTKYLKRSLEAIEWEIIDSPIKKA